MAAMRFLFSYGNKNKNEMKIKKQRKNDAQLIEAAICGYVLGKVRTGALVAML